MNQEESAEQLLAFAAEAVTPYHAVQEGVRLLKESGFEEWPIGSADSLKPGKGYYTVIYGTSLAAFRMPLQTPDAFRLGAAHTDSPCFRIKPNPDIISGFCAKLNVEAYGGAIYNTWMDRPLLIAGRICIRGQDPFHPKEILYRSVGPAAVIPNLAIHMNREVNKGMALKVQTDMEALVSCFAPGMENRSREGLLSQVAKESGIEKEEILDADLYLVNAEAGCRIGYQKEMLQSPRLDNLTSCLACLNGLKESAPLEHEVQMIALFDNEECGSRSKQGAGSTILVTLMEKIFLAAGIESRKAFLNAVTGSFLVSLDVAHASHPNHMEKSDPTNPISLAGGVIIKMNTNQRYATDASAVSAVEAICREKKIMHQKFINHGDSAGGGTIGSILSSTIPCRTADIGIPILGMHSCRELTASANMNELNCFMTEYFRT